MDRTIKITLGVFIIILVGFVSVVGYDSYTLNAYRTSLTGTYSYTLSLTTDSGLSNVTLFVPVPEDSSGNSPIVSKISARDISGLPADWKTTLFDTGKETIVKITTEAITPPPGTTPQNPYIVTLRINASSDKVIDTLTPVENGVIFRPVQDLRPMACAPIFSGLKGTPVCAEYVTPLYADYTAAPNTTVAVSSTLDGVNRWKVFEPQSNEYHSRIELTLSGESHGWTTAKGTLSTGIGSYSIPKPLM